MKRLTVLCIPLLAHCLFAAPMDGAQGAHSYSARGIVEKIAPNLSQVTIHHQASPGYMMEMTMDFNVRNTNELSAISPHDEITFTLVVSKDDEWIENVHRIGHSAETTSSKMSMPMDMLKPSDLLPDYALTSEGGKQIRISDFRGKAVAFTFFFTRCPLPDYCPRMNHNFEDARKILLENTNAPANWQFLSISFDPVFDTPEMLAGYAMGYRGEDATGWLFASAPTNVLSNAAQRLDLMVMHQGNSISHNLRTVVLDPAGRIYKQFDGNKWTPQQLADAIVQAARSSRSEPLDLQSSP